MRFKRLLAQAIGLCLAAVTAAATAWAATPPGAFPEAPDSPDPYALEAPAPGAALLSGARTGEPSGTCGKQGDNLTWTLTQETDGWYTLTISGSGAMADYTGNGGPWFSYRSSIKTLVLQKGLTSIGSYAFDGYKLASITIPEGVETIGEWAFQNCSNLEELTIPKSVTSIGEWAFAGCTALPSVTVPGGVETIGEHTFYNCGSLTELVLSEGVTSIGEEAFRSCEKLPSVSIPSTVTEIAPSAFEDCFSLETVVFPSAASLKTIGSSAFYGCSGLAGDLTLPEGVETIGDNAFCYCSSLASVKLPASLKTIEGSAFYGCSGLAGELAIPEGVETIGSDAFCDCSKLTSVVFPSAAPLKIIGNGAFYGCSSLAGDLTLPEGVETIGDNAFCYCSSLASVKLPASLKTIEGSAFQGCSGLTAVSLPASLKIIGRFAFSECSGLGGTLAVPEGVETIGDYAFFLCSSLESVSIPGSVKTIGFRTFDGCSGLGGTLAVPEGVETIGYRAFFRCSGLTAVSLPASLKAIEDCAFYGCSGLAGELAVPEGVETIGDGAFYGCSSLAAVSLPASLKTIEGGAFYGCSGLKTVVYTGTAPLEDLCGGHPESTSFQSGLTYRCAVTIEGGGDGASVGRMYSSGDSVTLKAGTKAGHTFNGWTLTGTVPANQPDLSQPDLAFTMPIGPVTASANWTVNSHAVIIEDGGDGSSGGGTYEYGASVALSVGTKTGHTFTGWTVTGTVPADLSDTSKAELTFSMPDGPVTASAGWTANSHAVTVKNGGTGASASGSHAYGASVTLRAGTKAGHTFSGWTVTGTVPADLSDTSKAELTFSMPDGPVTASASWTVNSYAVTLEGGGTGTSGGGTYAYGASVTLRAGTKAGHTFTGWTVTGVTLTADQLKAETLTFPMPDGPVTASVNWALPVPTAVSQTGSTVRLTFTGGRPAGGARVLAALDGTGALSGTYDAAGSVVSFQRPLETGRKLFFLDPETFIPLAKPAILE